MSTDNWNAHTYSTTVAPFVPRLTARVVGLLALQPGDTLLDLGCGDGVLTGTFSRQCKQVIGVDSSPAMIAACPPADNATYTAASALSLPPDLPRVHKIFSNAALHWILRTTPAARAAFFARCHDQLLPGGSFVAECGAHGNVAEVHAAVTSALLHRGVAAQTARDSAPWWFGSQRDFRGLLEGAGFAVEVLETELRQTELTAGSEGGIRGWVRLFASTMLACLPAADREAAVEEVAEALEGVGRREDGGMWVNYVRVRFVARRPE